MVDGPGGDVHGEQVLGVGAGVARQVVHPIDGHLHVENVISKHFDQNLHLHLTFKSQSKIGETLKHLCALTGTN